MKWLCLILLLLILVEVYGQRGGGGGGRRGGSRSRSRSSFGSSAASRARRRAYIEACKAKCAVQFTDPAELSKCHAECDPPFNWKFFGGILSLFGGIACISSCWTQYQGSQYKEQKLNELTQASHDFEADSDELKERFYGLISGNWEIEFFQNKVAYTTSYFTILPYPSNNKRNIFGISMFSRDSCGCWGAKGYVTYTNEAVRLLFFKDYNDKRAAGQTGYFKTLVYEGQWQQNEFKGRWFYQGFEASSTYSGPFTLRNIKQS